MGFSLKRPRGTTVSTDLYLSNSVVRLYPDLPVDLTRQVPIYIEPSDLRTDVYACTHSHADHADSDTIANLRNKDTMQFIGPSLTCGVYKELGVEDSRIRHLWP